MRVCSVGGGGDNDGSYSASVCVRARAGVRGRVAVGVVFDHEEVSASFEVVVVQAMSISLQARPYPLFAGSDFFNQATMRAIASTGTYQRAALSARVQCSDNISYVATAAHGVYFGFRMNSGVLRVARQGSGGCGYLPLFAVPPPHPPPSPQPMTTSTF